MVRQKTQVALSAHTFSGGRMLDELNEGIAEALEDCADGLNETPQRLGKRTVTVTLTLSSDGNGILKTTHKLDVKVPRPEVGDLAWLEGSGAVVDLRLDPGTTQLDLERVARLNKNNTATGGSED